MGTSLEEDRRVGDSQNMNSAYYGLVKLTEGLSFLSFGIDFGS